MIAFVNSFLSYLMLMVVIIVAAGAMFALGLFLRKNKDKKAMDELQEGMEE